MAEPLSSQRIQTPPSAAPPKASEPLIFTMPEEYRAGGVGKKLTEPMKEAPKVPAPTPKPVPPPVAAPAPGLIKTPAKRQTTKRLLVLGVLVVLVFALGGYALVRFTGSTPEEVVVTKPTVKPVTKPVETPKPVPEPTPTPEPTPEPFPIAATPGKDTDSDGLTDVEESIVYATNPRLPDSDADGFLDGNEVFHRYNPQGLAPGTLLESGLVKQYEAVGAYRLLYPSIWYAQAVGSDGNVTFTATTGEILALSLESKENPDQTLSDWFVKKFPDTASVSTMTKNGYSSITSENKVTAYVDLGAIVLTCHFDTGIKGTVDYLQTFQMMVNSIERAGT